jgi:ABC-type ATPase involved in cell division
MSVLHATRDLAVALVDVTQHLARLSEALLTLLLPHELRDHPEAVPLQRRGARVVFSDVTFAYREEHNVFENFSLELEPDQRVGLVGPSGGGKSTLFTLLQRFYDVQDGRILIDGQDISMVTQDSLRAAISVVPQDTSLFQRSVMENIRYGRPDATDEEVLQAAVAARCEFIEALPEGFATRVGDRGLRLSGGQRQRIAIARGFLKKARSCCWTKRRRRSTANPKRRSGRLGAIDAGPDGARDRASALDPAQFPTGSSSCTRTHRSGRSPGCLDPARGHLPRAGDARNEPAGQASGLTTPTSNILASGCRAFDTINSERESVTSAEGSILVPVFAAIAPKTRTAGARSTPV